jgi:hypothetical protein
MPNRLVKQTVIVVRDDKRVRPPIGKPFNFTKDEIEELNARNPNCIGPVTKVVEDEGDAGDEGDAADQGAGNDEKTAETGKPADTGKPTAPPKPGKGKSTDEEL